MDVVHVMRQTTLDVCITLILMYLLAQNELLRAHGGRRALRVAYATTLVGIPVLALFIMVIAVRFLFLMGIL